MKPADTSMRGHAAAAVLATVLVGIAAGIFYLWLTNMPIIDTRL